MCLVGCCPLLDRELTLRGGVADIVGVGVVVRVVISGIRGDEYYLSFQFSSCFLVSAGKYDGAEDGS